MSFHVDPFRVQSIDQVEGRRTRDEGLLESLYGTDHVFVVFEGPSSEEDLERSFFESCGEGEVIGSNRFDE